MNFGNTLEEQYAKISAINKLSAKFVKVTRIILVAFEAILSLLLVIYSEQKLLFFVFGAICVAVSLWVGGKFGMTYFWTWVILCEKYSPKHLAYSFANALDNSYTYGYVFGGTSGAESASVGTLIVIFVFAVFLLGKGGKYAKKYRNLPRKEIELKKQIEAKYGRIL